MIGLTDDVAEVWSSHFRIFKLLLADRFMPQEHGVGIKMELQGWAREDDGAHDDGERLMMGQEEGIKMRSLERRKNGAFGQEVGIKMVLQEWCKEMGHIGTG